MIANNAKKAKLNKKKVSRWKRLLIFLTFEFVFTCLTMPLMVFYGPFETVKKTVVGTFWSTWRHQYLAQIFLKDDAIYRILGYDGNPDITNGEKIKELNFDINRTGNIEVANIDGGKFNAKLIVIPDPTKVVVGYSSHIPKKGETTSTIAKKNNAIAAINAGGFIDIGYAGTGGAPDGLIMHNGEVIYDSTGGGERETVAITKKGMLIVGTYTLDELKQYDVKEAVSFGPPLIINGKRTNPRDWGIAPRTAIGQKATGEILFLAVDGRSFSSVGASMEDLQDILLQFGAVNASNLDGGSSTTMYYNGKVINKPSEPMGERSVASVFMAMP